MIDQSHIDLVAVVEAAGIQLIKSGSRYRGCCPFHQDKDPSLFVYDHHVHCYGCGFHDDAIGFTQKIHGLSFKEALRHLGIERGELTPDKRQEIQRQRQRQSLVKQFREWEVDASNEVGALCRGARKVLAEIKTPADLLKYGAVYHSLETWQYHLDILTHGTDEEKHELWQGGYYGR